MTAAGGLHHLEVWVADLTVARRCWGWLLEELGWSLDSEWPAGVSYRRDDVYVVLEAGGSQVREGDAKPDQPDAGPPVALRSRARADSHRPAASGHAAVTDPDADP